MGFNLETYTALHVGLSLAGIVSGFVVAFGALAGRRFPRTTTVFLVTTAATSLTGFGFPAHKILPSHIVGIITLAVIAGVVVAERLPLPPRVSALLVVSNAMVALYLNVFVLVFQAFDKVPALRALAPTQSEPPFAIVHVVVFVLFGVLTVVAALKALRSAATASLRL
jgi:hypothetical protein